MAVPEYAYGPPVTVTGNTGGANPNTGTTVSVTGSSPHTPPSDSSTNVGNIGSPSEELTTMYTPVLSTLTPATIAKGSANANVTCTGSGFVAANTARPGTIARVNGVDQVTTYVSPTSVTYVGKHSVQTGAGVLPVTVANLGVTSASRNFTYT